MLGRLGEVASPQLVAPANCVSGDGRVMHHGDGIDAAAALEDASLGLLLTDPRHGISRRCTCEDQTPRRLRRDGAGFIMPRGVRGPVQLRRCLWLAKNYGVC